MKHIGTFLVGVLSLNIAFATDFFDYHQSLFDQQNFCSGASAQDRQDEAEFYSMYIQLKLDTSKGKTSRVEVLDFLMPQTTLTNRSTKRLCTLVQHGGCYSVACYSLNSRKK